MIDKNAMILKLEENLHTTGPNIGKPNFSLVEKLYPEYTRKMLRDWYSKKDEILKSHHKHKRFKLDNPKANGEYPEMEEELDKYITELRALMRILRLEAEQRNTELKFRACCK